MNCRMPGVKNVNTCYNIFKNCCGSVWSKMEFVKDRSETLDGCLVCTNRSCVLGSNVKGKISSGRNLNIGVVLVEREHHVDEE